MQQLPQPLAPSNFIEGLMRSGMRTTRTLLECRLKSLLVELMDDVTHGLGVAAEFAGDLVGALFVGGACEQDQATTQDEGIRRAQTRLQGLALSIRKWTREDWFFHGAQDKSLPTILPGHALGCYSSIREKTIPDRS